MLGCLAEDAVATESPVTIYCDGARCADHVSRVEDTRSIARSCAPVGARIVERKANFGLARSIVSGVTEQCEKYGRVIVLEDDLLLSPFALTYFNEALNRYEDEARVMHVAGYMYPVEVEAPGSFFYREASCWGWATWARAWTHFEPSARTLLQRLYRSHGVYEFDIRGSFDYERMLYLQMKGEIDSWAIRWYASVFLKGGLCLHPRDSLVANLGVDGTGTHFRNNGNGKGHGKFDVVLASNRLECFPGCVKEDVNVVEAIRDYRMSWKSGKKNASIMRKFSRKTSYLKRKMDVLFGGFD